MLINFSSPQVVAAMERLGIHCSLEKAMEFAELAQRAALVGPGGAVEMKVIGDAV